MTIVMRMSGINIQSIVMAMMITVRMTVESLRSWILQIGDSKSYAVPIDMGGHCGDVKIAEINICSSHTGTAALGVVLRQMTINNDEIGTKHK